MHDMLVQRQPRSYNHKGQPERQDDLVPPGHRHGGRGLLPGRQCQVRLQVRRERNRREGDAPQQRPVQSDSHQLPDRHRDPPRVLRPHLLTLPPRNAEGGGKTVQKGIKMKMKHTVRLKSGSEAVYEFQTKAASKQALENARTLHKAFNTIVCVFVEPVNHPE